MTEAQEVLQEAHWLLFHTNDAIWNIDSSQNKMQNYWSSIIFDQLTGTTDKEWQTIVLQFNPESVSK